MKLSRLVFNIVKNVKFLDDMNFNYEAFRVGEYDSDYDYKNSINNVYTPLNEALHRLSDLNKIPTKVVTIEEPSGIKEYTIPSGTRIKKIVGVIATERGVIYSLGYRRKSKDKLIISYSGKIEVEYIEDLPNFDETYVHYDNDPNELGNERDVDLEEYGINETMASYIIEYCKGILFEPIAPEIANMHLTRAEQYFGDLEEYERMSYQDFVQPIYWVE